MTAIDPISAFPAKSDPAFKTRVESFFGSEFPNSIDQINAAILAFNANDLRGSSSTSYTPNASGLGLKTFVVQSGKSWLPGMWVTGGYTSNGREYWAGVIESYSGTQLDVDVKIVSGHGSARTSWQISFSPPITDLIGDQEVIVHTGNGYASANTKRRRYSTVFKNTGTDITYNDSATLGASFGINVDGDYYIERRELSTVTALSGIALNPVSGTTNYPAGLSFEQQIGSDSGTSLIYISAVRKLSAGDVVVPHDSSLANGTSDSVNFRIKRIR